MYQNIWLPSILSKEQEKLFSYMSSAEYKIDFIPVAMSYETHELCLHTGY